MPGTRIELVHSLGARDFKSLPLLISYYSKILKILNILHDIMGLGISQLQIQLDSIRSILKLMVTI